MRRVVALGFLSLALMRCGGDDDSEATCGPKPVFPCAHCGTDALYQAECVEGEWTCPGYMKFTNECPKGTCFGYGVCCGPNGEKSGKTCALVSESNKAPTSGSCPKGFVDCTFPQEDASADTGPSEPPDAAGGVADCLAQQYPCEFCCGKYYWEGRKPVLDSLHACVCAGPCQTACADNSWCQDQSGGPSGTCNQCILAQLEPGAACASAVCTSSECAPYLDCLTSCSP